MMLPLSWSWIHKAINKGKVLHGAFVRPLVAFLEPLLACHVKTGLKLLKAKHLQGAVLQSVFNSFDMLAASALFLSRLETILQLVEAGHLHCRTLFACRGSAQESYEKHLHQHHGCNNSYRGFHSWASFLITLLDGFTLAPSTALDNLASNRTTRFLFVHHVIS